MIFCIFASVACILIGKDDEYEKISNSVCKDLKDAQIKDHVSMIK